jgi:hypothetical protein
MCCFKIIVIASMKRKEKKEDMTLGQPSKEERKGGK